MVAVGLSKAVIVIVNIIFTLFGLACLVIGVLLRLAWENSRDAFYRDSHGNEDLAKAGDAFTIGGIVLGVFIVVFSVMGCIGACCSVRCLLLLYAVSIFALFVGECVVVGYAASKSSNLDNDLKKSLEETLVGYNESSTGGSSKAWSDLFDIGECCGVTDYKKDLAGFVKDVTHRNAAGIPVTSDIPITCCSGVKLDDKLTTKLFTDKKQCLVTPSKDNARVKGCYSKIKNWLSHYRGILIGVGCAIIVLELLLIALSAYVYREIGD